MYDHFQKTRQLARGEGKIEFSVDIRCIGTSGKTVCPKVDQLAHRNAWKRGVAPGKNVPQPKRARIPCILLLYVKRTIVIQIEVSKVTLVIVRESLQVPKITASPPVSYRDYSEYCCS